MKKSVFWRFSLLLMLMCSAVNLHADEINYSRYVAYDGKVDKAGQPFKKGKLITTYRGTTNGIESDEKDILEGEFNNNRVEKAKLRLGRYNSPLWITRTSFEGTLEYRIEEGGKAVTYTLIEGVIKDSRLAKLKIYPDNPLVITRIPQIKGCLNKVTPIRIAGENLELTESNLAEWGKSIAPFKLKALGLSEVKKSYSCYLDESLNIVESFEPELFFNDQKKVYYDASKDEIVIAKPSGDVLKLHRKSGEINFVRKYPDAHVVCKTNMIQVKFADGSVYNGSIKLKSTKANAIYLDILEAATYAESGISFTNGTLTTADGKTVNYIDGRTEAEIAEEKARKEQEAKQAEAKRQADMKKARAKLIGTWELLGYYPGEKVIYTLKADGTMLASYTYNGEQTKNMFTAKFTVSAEWEVDGDGFCVNKSKKAFISADNITFNFTDYEMKSNFESGCREYGRENFTKVYFSEFIKMCDGGSSFIYNDKWYTGLTIKGTTMTGKTYRRGEQVDVKFRKLK